MPNVRPFSILFFGETTLHALVHLLALFHGLLVEIRGIVGSLELGDPRWLHSEIYQRVPVKLVFEPFVTNKIFGAFLEIP